MSILNLTVSQYIVVALLITLWAFIVRWVMAWVNNRKTEEVKKLWKKRGDRNQLLPNPRKPIHPVREGCYGTNA